MSEMKKLKFCELTKLVTINWIENNYQGEAIFPLALKYITATFIETIVEQWKKSSANAYLEGLNRQTLVFLSKLALY